MKAILVMHSLWLYRHFIFSVVKQEFILRYRGSLLSLVWAIINPLVLIIVYTLIFSQIMQSKLSDTSDPFAYSIYLCAGLLPWSFFTEVITRSQTMFLDSANLLKKSNFPRLCLPIIVISTALINFFILFALFIIFLLLSHHFPGWILLAIFPVLMIQLLLSLSLGIFTATLNVFFRDIGHCMDIILQFWFWLTPIVYPIQILPAKLSSWLRLNPMLAPINAYQNLIQKHSIPDWISLFPVLLLSMIMLLLAGLTYRSFSGELVDEL